MAGNLKTNSIQLGDSATDSQNFVLKTNVDGTGKLSRGGTGTLGDILVWDASGKLTLSAVPAAPAQSMIRLNTANGYGTTNTKIRRFTNVVTTQGTDITYADSATLGASFTINVAGVYAITYNDQFTSPSWMGLSLNTTQPTLPIYSLTASEVLSAAVASSTASWGATVATTMYFAAGSVVRAQADQPAGTTTNTCQFTITRVA